MKLPLTPYVAPYTFMDVVTDTIGGIAYGITSYIEYLPPIWQIMEELAKQMKYSKTDLAVRLVDAFFRNLNVTYTALLQSKVQQNGVYIYDLLPFEVKTPFLYQLKANNYCYTTGYACENVPWTSLPSSLQTLLAKEKLNFNFLNLTMHEWDLVSSSNPLANLTLKAFIRPECDGYIAGLSKLANPIELGMQIDLKKFYKIAFSDFCFVHINYLPSDFNDFLTTATYLGDGIAYNELSVLQCLQLPNFKLVVY